MKNIGDKDDPENRQNWRARMNLVWNPVSRTPKFIKGDSCRLLYIFSAEKTDRLRVQFSLLELMIVTHLTKFV